MKTKPNNHAHFLSKTKVGKYTIHLETEAEFLDVIGNKVLRSFPPSYSQSPLIILLEQKWFETGL
jgi:hypothetical protein